MKAQTWCNTNKNEGSIQQMALFSSFSKKLFKIPNCTLDSKTFFSHKPSSNSIIFFHQKCDCFTFECSAGYKYLIQLQDEGQYHIKRQELAQSFFELKKLVFTKNTILSPSCIILHTVWRSDLILVLCQAYLFKKGI